MADLTFGEVGKVIQFNLQNIDPTQNPPVVSPLNLLAATEIDWLYNLSSLNEKPESPVTSVKMQIIDPVNGVVQYTLKAGDLTKPSNIGKVGVVRWAVKVTFSSGEILYSNFDGQFSIKDDSQL